MDDVMLRWQVAQLQQVEKKAEIVQRLRELLVAAEAGELTGIIAIAPMVGDQVVMKSAGSKLELLSCLDLAKAAIMGSVSASPVPFKKI